MSAESIARWNSIPLSREQADTHLKRSRDAYDEDEDKDMKPDDADAQNPFARDQAALAENDDDDMSIASRTPSPPPRGGDDSMDVDKYDEYVGGVEREVITVETKLKPTNKGFAMLAKLGWQEGQPLGLSGDGRVDPIPFNVKNDLTGLGKTSQDVRMVEETVAQRRELDSERQVKETEEQRIAREDTVARRAAVQSELSTTLRPFYCTVCDKQFQNVAQYDEHTNSYAHHHKVRFRDMQLAQRQKQNTQEEVDKRKEKERKREEKELRKIAKAAGIKLAKPPVPSTSGSAAIQNTPSGSSSTGPQGGWATATQPSALPTTNSGWSSISSSTPPVQAAAPPQPQTHAHGAAPTFRTGGWSNLDTTTVTDSQPSPPQPPVPSPAAPPPTPPAFAQPPPFPPSAPPFPPASIPMRSSFVPAPPPASIPSAPSIPQPPQPTSSGFRPVQSSSWQPTAPPASAPRPPQPETPTAPPPTPQVLATGPPLGAPLGGSSTSKKTKKKVEAEARESSRSGWQSFQKGGRKK